MQCFDCIELKTFHLPDSCFSSLSPAPRVDMSSTAAASVESPPSHVRAAAAESFDDDVCEMLLMASQVVCRNPMK